MGIEQVLSLLGGIGGAVAVVVTSLRKRQDVSIEEMQRRIGSLETRMKSLEDELETERADNRGLREQLVGMERIIYRLRSLLAREGIDDPTVTEDVTNG